MKTIKRNLIAFSFILSFSVANSQQLANTYWTAYDTSNISGYFWHFDFNILYLSVDNINYWVQSHYTENGDTFKLVDNVLSICLPADTGAYTFLIQNDTLRFTLIYDPCTSRRDYLTNYYFVSLTTGIKVEHSFSGFQIFPNPFRDKLIINSNENELSEIILYDFASRELLEQKFTNSVTLNTERLAKGLYLYEVRSKNGLCKKGKVVKD